MNAGKTVAWNQAEPFPLVLITGPETYLASRATSRIRKQLQDANPALEITQLSEGEYSSGALFTLAAPSLFGDERLIVITGGTDDLAADLASYMQDPDPNCTIVLRLPNLVGHNGKIKSVFAKQGLTVSCEELKKDSEKLDFIRGEFKSAGVSIDAAASKLLLLGFSNDLGELGSACSQLVSLGKAAIGQAEVEAIFGGRLETNAFKIADAAMAGNAAEAIRLFRHGSATGVDLVALTAALTMRIRQLARLFNDRNANPAILGMAPWQIDKAKRELSGWSEAELIDLVQMAAKTDGDVKGAAREPEYSVEQLLMAMARAGK